MLGDMNAVKYAHNQFSDLTQEEFESTAMGLNPLVEHEPENALGLP